MNPLDQTQPASVLLTCQACGRRMLYIPSNDADQATAAISTSCRSCGSEVAVPAASHSGGSPEPAFDEAATARTQPQVLLPDGGAMPSPSEASTAILAPSSQAKSDTAPPDNPPVDVSTPISESDQYQTAAAMEPVAPQAPATWPVTEIGPQAKELSSGRRSLWLLVGTSLVLAALFVGGIILAQTTGSQSNEPVATPVTQPTASAPATIPAGFLQKTDADGLYSFVVPSSWKQKPYQGPAGTEFIIYTDPTQNATFEVESFATGTQAGGAPLDTLILLQTFHTLTAADISQPNSVPLAHETWVQETAKVTVPQNGAALTENVVVQTTSHNGTTFIIFLSSPGTSALGGESQTLLQVLGTFTFLG